MFILNDKISMFIFTVTYAKIISIHKNLCCFFQKCFNLFVNYYSYSKYFNKNFIM